MTSPLSTPAVLQGMADALPTHQQGDDSSDLASSYEVIALLVHSYLAALSFRLCGFEQDKPIPECERIAPRLPAGWNAGFGTLSFVYKHKQSSMHFLIRVDRMGSKVEIRGLAIGDENIHRFERTVRDVVHSNALPIRISMDDGREDRSDLVEKLSKAFVSEEAVTGILNDLKVKIVQKLIPKLQINGYEETAEAEETARSERRGQEAQGRDRPFPGESRPDMPYPQPTPLPDMARPRPGAPLGDFPPPGFEDEYEINRPLRGGGPFMSGGGHHPFDIGHDDLNPPGLGPHDPLRGSFIGGGLPRPGGSSGMHPTFDDPLFTGQGGHGNAGEGYDPQAPPGARWDPLGPGGRPRFPGPGNGRGGPFGESGGGGFGGGHII
ncbi:hypothetical protein C2857_006648 [Epichloe festucae Fl1]|uniref:Proteasome inhibitor PI31 subunit n=1 Tax=Epichloe festucae (strain Fl1) TaxID=877507 RepID=A0A7S9KM50_EPIFF|nr:hypothetical protein C2857_006648 [Epichloe festucae Fl1]